MAYKLTAKGQVLTKRILMEGPTETPEESFFWIAGAMMAVCGDPPPTDNDPPAAHKGYAWGQQFNREWNSYPAGSKE